MKCQGAMMNNYTDRRVNKEKVDVIKLMLDKGYREQFFKQENKRRQELREKSK
jgi:hypothetical protein